MDKVIEHLKQHWKIYTVAIWMAWVTGYLFSLNGQIQEIKQVSLKIRSDVDSTERILISTDSNVAIIKKQVDDTAVRMENVYKRVMRR